MRSKPQMLSLSIAIDMADYVRAESKCKDFGVDICVAVDGDDVKFCVMDHTGPECVVISRYVASQLSLQKVYGIVEAAMAKIANRSVHESSMPTDGEKL